MPKVVMAKDIARKALGIPAIISGQGRDLVKLYHGTTSEGLKGIRQEKAIRAGSYFGVNKPAVALTPDKKAAQEYAPHVLEVKIPRDQLVADPESNDNPDVNDALSNGKSVYALGDIYMPDVPEHLESEDEI
jgi:hypothetical protein